MSSGGHFTLSPNNTCFLFINSKFRALVAYLGTVSIYEGIAPGSYRILPFHVYRADTRCSQVALRERFFVDEITLLAT